MNTTTNTLPKDFTIEFFINFFEKIPAFEIGSAALESHCSLWHLAKLNGLNDWRVYNYNELENLPEIIAFEKTLAAMTLNKNSNCEIVWHINDGVLSLPATLHKKLYPMLPKERLLYCLNLVKKYRDKLQTEDLIDLHNAIKENNYE